MRKGKDHGKEEPQATKSVKMDWVVEFIKENPSLNLRYDAWDKRSIYRVPSHIRDPGSEAYEPHLKPMQTHKVRAVTHILKISEVPLDEYVKALKKNVESLMEAYAQLDEKWKDKDKFIKLMIHDGCFLLEVIRIIVEGDYGEYAYEDPVFHCESLVGNINVIASDIFRSENQIPIKVLVRLVSTEKNISKTQSVKHICGLVIRFSIKFRAVFPVDEINWGLEDTKYLHILDLYRSLVIGKDPWSNVQGDSSLIPAKSLQKQAGVKFENCKSHGLNNIKFEKGFLYLPHMYIWNCSKGMLLNLIAFEQLHSGAIPVVGSYIFLLGGLIRDADDVACLTDAKIIETILPGDEAIAKLMNEVNDEMDFQPDWVLEHVSRDLETKYKQRTKKWQRRTRMCFSTFREKREVFQEPMHFLLPSWSNCTFRPHGDPNHLCHPLLQKFPLTDPQLLHLL